MGGHLTDLINMADCQEWKGQRFKKIYVRKTTQHEEKFFKLFIKGMIIFDLNMEHDEVYGKFVLTVCICSILYFCKKFADCKKTDSASLSQNIRILYYSKAQNEKKTLQKQPRKQLSQ